MRRLLLAAATLALSAPALSAQTQIYTTFGPGNTYNTGTGFTVGGGSPPSWDESSFFFGGTTGTLLGGVSFAAFNYTSGPLTVQFLTGIAPTTSSVIESWSVPSQASSAAMIFSLTSLTNSALVNGSTYWLRLEAPASAGWAWNDRLGSTGPAYQSSDLGVTWNLDTHNGVAFAVTSLDASSVTPEPATMTLMATGLVGLAGFTRRRKRA